MIVHNAIFYKKFRGSAVLFLIVVIAAIGCGRSPRTSTAPSPAVTSTQAQPPALITDTPQATPPRPPVSPAENTAATNAIIGKWNRTVTDSMGTTSITYEFHSDGTMTTIQKTSDGVTTTVQGTYTLVAGTLNQTYTSSTYQKAGQPPQTVPIVGSATPFSVSILGNTMTIGGQYGLVFKRVP